ncbi:hypothetical protein [Nocardioides sp. SYSU D00065]|uniref:hypothetical protein n=1 Tax=Nocardioides sp. SYSU D00065 TaxID=2817378 RepID=UPI001B32E594|nr:hypothetical protein [Nocardioides sp. SYSU D00065]
MTSAQDVHDQVWALLDAVPGINTYDGEVPSTPPLDEDDRVHAYAVLYVSAGRRAALMLDGTQSSLFSGFQVTCVGGDPTRALWCVDQVRAALLGASVTVDDREHLITASETDPGPVRRDDDVTPPRHYVPDRYDLFIP